MARVPAGIDANDWDQVLANVADHAGGKMQRRLPISATPVK